MGDQRGPHIFLDLDGVLADFDRHFQTLFGVHPRALPDDEAFWRPVAATPRFFADLPPMPDAFELYESVRRLEPTILSGVPSAIADAPERVTGSSGGFRASL